MRASAPATYVLVLFLGEDDLEALKGFIDEGFRNALMNGCWKLEVHLFTEARLEDIIANARDSILNNIHLSFRLWDYHDLDKAGEILSWLSRRTGGDVKKICVYVSPSLKDRVSKYISLLLGDYTEFLKRSEGGQEVKRGVTCG